MAQLSSRFKVLFLISLLLSIPLGSGVFTFYYAHGFSYMSDDATACANCHVMQETFDAWVKSSHRGVAVCNDCHVPQDFFGKWYTKAENGLHHSVAFTLGSVPVNIKARKSSRKVAENNCIRCHKEFDELHQ